MTNFKLIALDLDGTLLRSDLEISPTVRKWIRKAEEQGVLVSFATGRGRSSSEQYWNVVSPQSPMIVVNGAEVWLNHDQLLARHYLPQEAVPRFYKLAEEYDAWFWVTSPQTVVGRENWLKEYEGGKDWLKFGFAHSDPEVLEEIRAIIADWPDFEVTSSAPDNLEVSVQGINKASGLQEAATALGIKPEEIAVVGDSLNDLAMIEWAGLGAAMGNGDARVKAAADYITATNDEDGVAQFIQLVLEKL